MLPEVSKSKKVSRFFWAATLFLIIAAFVVPNLDISLLEDSPRAEDTTDPFAEPVHDFERAYHTEGLEELDPQKALDFAPLLKARALTRVGSVDAVEVTEAADQIRAYRSQIAEQSSDGAREALRNHRNELVVEQIRLIDDEDAIRALDTVRDDYIEAFGVDPSYVTEMPEE